MQHLLGHGQLLVVETDDDVLLGTVEVRTQGPYSTVIIRSGYVGRPVVVDADDVVSITPATEHPDVAGYQDAHPDRKGQHAAYDGASTE